MISAACVKFNLLFNPNNLSHQGDLGVPSLLYTYSLVFQITLKHYLTQINVYNEEMLTK